MIDQLQYSYPDEFLNIIKKIKNRNKNVDLCELDGIGEQLDAHSFSKRFFTKKVSTADVSVDANANIEDTTVAQYISEISKPVLRMNAYYLLWKYSKELFGHEFAEKAINAQLMKDVYINDFHTFGINAYCFNFTCMDIIYIGLPYVKKCQSQPPKHLSSFIGQIIQFITYAGNHLAGASAISDVLIGVSYFVEKFKTENLNLPEEYIEKVIKQEIQSLIYSVNQPFRGGIQSFFFNVSIYDQKFLEKISNEYIFPNEYHVKIETIKYVQNLYLDLMNETLQTSPVTFPITTACFAVDENKNILDSDFLNYIAEKNLKYSFINIFAGKTSITASCCRLRNDGSNSDFFNSIGGSSTKIGSLGVVTINIPRLAFKSNNREEFLEYVQEYAEMAAKINRVKRHILKKRIDGGYYPLYTLGFMNLNKQYCTTGLIGINEACEIQKLPILEKQGQQLALDIIDVVNSVNKLQEKKYKHPFNIEQIPGESVAVKLAEADRLLGYNDQYEIYSNQFIPLTSDANFLDRIKLQGVFDKHLTGGAILHLNMIDQITDVNFMKQLIETAIQNGVVYHAVNYNLQKCEDNHLTVGKNEKCPVCGKTITDNFTRVVGFLVNTKNFNKTRREIDYPNRKWYNKESSKL